MRSKDVLAKKSSNKEKGVFTQTVKGDQSEKIINMKTTKKNFCPIIQEVVKTFFFKIFLLLFMNGES